VCPIGTVILPQMSPLVLKFANTIFNRSLALDYFLTHWKESKVVLLPKPGKHHSSPLNYLDQ
jgi:hypothetical protein